MAKRKIIEPKFADNCAGLPIKCAITMFSSTLIDGYNKFADNAENRDLSDDVMVNNSGCILFSISAIEGKLNEFISIQLMIDMNDGIPFLKELKKMERTISIEEKWNFLAEIFKFNKWNNSKEPFQSYNTIKSLRNELVHYKGTPYGKDETPTKKIKGLMNELNVSSKASFIEDDCSTWIDDMLNSPKLGKWVVKKTDKFIKEIDKICSHNPYEK